MIDTIRRLLLTVSMPLSPWPNNWRSHQILGIMAVALLLSFTSATLAKESEWKILKIASSSSYTTLDPHLGFDWLSYPTLSPLCANLTVVSSDFKTYIYDLAKSIELQDSGKILKITLLEGVQFHNQKTVKAADVVYSLNRMLSPALNSAGATLFNNIVGFKEYRQGKSDAIAGVRLLGEYELEIRLKRPSASFYKVLATNFGCILPEGDDPKGLEIPISAGPFAVESLTDDGVLTMNRTASAGRRYGKAFETLQIYSNLPTDKQLAKYSNKEIDLILDGLPWETIGATLMKTPVQALKQTTATTYLTLNTQLPPFDRLETRQAVNFAINRQALVDIMKGATAPTTQIIPPGFPEHVENKNKYYYDPNKAIELLKGVKKQPIKANMYAVDDDLYRRLVVSMVSDLRKVGIIVTPYFGSHVEVLNAASSAEGVQIVYSDGLGWIADYPDAANFYYPLLSSEARTPGGWNWAKYYNEEVNTLANYAESIVEEDRQEERLNVWRNVYDMIEDEAPWVPLYNRGTNNIISFEALEYIKNSIPDMATGFTTQYIYKWR